MTAPDTSGLRLPAELSIQNAAEVRAELLAVLASGDPLTLDLSEVSEFDTAGLQVLLLARREAVGLNLGFALTDVPSTVLDTLAFVGLDGTLEPIGPSAHSAGSRS
jgi:anti-sigma B factor antagonist